MYNTIPAILPKRQKQLRRRPAEERVMTPAEARDLTREMGIAQGTTCPDCGKEQMTNGLIAWCENAHVFKARKTMLIRAAPQNDGKCKSCAAAIVWALTENGKHMPMNAGFAVVRREGELGMSLRVYRDQSHFATCPNAKKRRKGSGNALNRKGA